MILKTRTNKNGGTRVFKNLFRNIRKREENKENSEKLLEEKQTQSENLNEDNEVGDYECKVDKKEDNVKVKEFAEYKIFYSDKFRECKNLSDVLDIYIEYTDSSQLIDDLRLRYISMYIFKTKISEERLGIDMLKYLVNKRLSNMSNKLIQGKESIDDTIDDDLYLELKTRFDRIEPTLKGFEDKLNLDLLLISIFSDYGLEAMSSDLCIKTILRFLNEMNFTIMDNKIESVRNYLKHRILNVIDTEFWESDKEEIHRCELFIAGRYIKVKTNNFNHIAFKSGEGPISISTHLLSAGNLFSVFIGDDTVFFMNKMDKDKILKYYDYLNYEILKEVDKEIDIIEKEINNASPELNTIVNNFLNVMPQTLFLNKDSYIAFELLNSYNSFIAQQLLDSTVEQRDEIIDKFKEDNYLYTNTKEFIDENYIKLVKIAGRYINIPEKYHSSVIWKLIRNYYPEFISQHWENENQIYFENNESLSSLSEYVDAYCRCSEISTNNVINVGKFTYYLMSKGMFSTDINENFVQCNIQLIQEVFSKIEEIELEIFENKLTSTPVNNKDRYSINDVDLMDGYEFEQFLSYLFTKMGYTTEVTKSSGDQGMDIIVEKGGNRVGIQSKCYSSKVTNRAVQEIFTALNHYNCSKGIVVTNNYFTDSAVELAQSNNVILWDRDILKIKIGELFS